MLWQVAVAAAIGSLFYLQPISTWVRRHLRLGSTRANGFLFAAIYGTATSTLMLTLFTGRTLPRFNDVFLVGILLTGYLFTWEPAVCLLAVSMLVSIAMVSQTGGFRVEGFAQWYRLTSFTVVSALTIVLIQRIKAKRMTTQKSEASENRYAMHASAGAE
jgi:hypothetical protein